MSILFLTLMLTGTFALGVSNIFRKKALVAGADDQAFLTIGLLLTTLFILPPLLVLGMPKIGEGFWIASTISIILNLVSQNLFIKAFKYSDASLVSPLRLLTPPLTIITGVIFLDEIPSAVGIIGIFVTMIGLWFLVKKPGTNFSFNSFIHDKGTIYGLIGSALFAVTFPFDKIAVVESSALFKAFIISTGVLVCTYFFNLMTRPHFNKTLIDSATHHFRNNFWDSLFNMIGIISTSQALTYSLVAYASSLKRLDALWTVILAGKFLGEKDRKHRLIASLIMMVGILISVIWK